MCDCPEIQETWKLKQGDWTAFPMTGVISIKHIDEDDDYYSPKKVKTIKRYNTWLPRQDQIQEMVGTYHNDKSGRCFCWVCTMGRFNGFLEEHINQEFEQEIECFNKQKDFQVFSMEQLWLAFYMYEKHKKTWDGKEWIKEEK